MQSCLPQMLVAAKPNLLSLCELLEASQHLTISSKQILTAVVWAQEVYGSDSLYTACLSSHMSKHRLRSDSVHRRGTTKRMSEVCIPVPQTQESMKGIQSSQIRLLALPTEKQHESCKAQKRTQLKGERSLDGNDSYYIGTC